ncbi:class I SAM-dependent methyltransferase [Gordonia sinesedis]
MTTSSLDSEPIRGLIESLYAAADQIPQGGSSGFDGRTGTAAERADAAEDRYLPVSPMAGRLMYSLVHAARPAVVLEFGMSYGISTLFLAAAVRDNGIGHVYTTELNAKKIETAARTFQDAGVADLITILDGDALETIPRMPGDIGFVLLDGWKELYVPVFDLIEDRLVPGALLLADNTANPDVAGYLERVRDPANGYTSVSLPGKGQDTMELSCRT